MADPVPYNETELLLRLAEGNERSFQQIFDIYWQGLFSYAFNVLGSREAAEDIVQEIFSFIWQNRKTLQIRTSLKGYLFTAVHYRALKEIRVNRNILLDSSGLEERLMADSPESILTLKDLQEQINIVVQSLPLKCREIYLFSREQQYSHKEIADKLGISTKTVEAQLTIALRRVRTQLGNNFLFKLFFPFL